MKVYAKYFEYFFTVNLREVADARRNNFGKIISSTDWDVASEHNQVHRPEDVHQPVPQKNKFDKIIPPPPDHDPEVGLNFIHTKKYGSPFRKAAPTKGI